MKTNPLEKMKKRSPRTRFFWCYTLGFLLCAAGCYCWFLIKGKSLIVDSDGWRQHFAAFVYLGQYGREVARTLLATHKLVLPQWDFPSGWAAMCSPPCTFTPSAIRWICSAWCAPPAMRRIFTAFYPCCDCIWPAWPSVLSAL